MLRASAQHRAAPGECLGYMNSNLAVQSDSAMFTTVFYGILDTRTGELQFANGGHNRPYVVRWMASRGRFPMTAALSSESWTDLRMTPTRPAWLPAKLWSCLPMAFTEAQRQKRRFFGDNRLEQLFQPDGGVSAATTRGLLARSRPGIRLTAHRKPTTSPY